MENFGRPFSVLTLVLLTSFLIHILIESIWHNVVKLGYCYKELICANKLLICANKDIYELLTPNEPISCQL